MALCLRRLSSSLNGLISSCQVLVNGGLGAGFCTQTGSCSVADSGDIKLSACKTYSSRKFRIRDSMIPSSSWTVLKILQNSGFRSYFVGGCVRDLILHRVPKDFDVVTTATLEEIKEKFHRCWIIGKRFPICRVQIKDSIVEVSSFETIARNTENREDFLSANMPVLSDGANVLLWRNSMSRDFTVNSLFFDPFTCKILDFTNGVEDLRSLMLRTLLPAELCFKEDCAIILRGLRIAARLGLRLSKEIENAIESFLPAVSSLSKDRLMMELNYMLSYGAALPSLFMLKRFGLLEVLLPFQVAYLKNMAKPAQGSSILVKLISNMDKLVSCDRPCDCTLWVSLLAFHLALVNHPQDAFVIWAIASVLYYGQWKEGVQYTIRQAGQPIDFVPEITGSSSFGAAELAERVRKLASLAQEYAAALSDADSMLEYPNIPSSGLVIIPKKVAKDVGEIFQPLANDVESFRNERKSFAIDYRLLGRGFLSETRFALGKIILDTMNDGVLQGEGKTIVVGKNRRLALSDVLAQELSQIKVEISLRPSKDVSWKECANQQVRLKQGKRSPSVSKKPEEVKVKESHEIVMSALEVPEEILNCVGDSKPQDTTKSLSWEEKKSDSEYSMSDDKQNAVSSDSEKKSTSKREKLSSVEAGDTKKVNEENQQQCSKPNTNLSLLSDIFI